MRRCIILLLLLFVSSPLPIWAVTYYVATTGSNSNSCATATIPATPKLTITNGLTCLSASDTLIVRAGTYAESLDSNSITIPSGSSWVSPITIQSYAGETVLIRPPNGYALNLNNGQTYTIWQDLILDGTNAGTSASGAGFNGSTYNRLLRCEIRNFHRHGATWSNSTGISDHNEMVNCLVHDNGTAVTGTQEHGIYITSSYNLIDGGQYYNNGASGIQIYDSTWLPSNNIVRNVKVYNNSRTFTAHTSPGITINSGSGNKVYNSIIYETRNAFSLGVRVDLGASNTELYSLTIYGSPGSGLEITGAATGTTYRNVVSYLNTPNLSDSGVSSVASNNSTSGTNPVFVNAGTYDFHLQLGSPLINAGYTLGIPYNTDYAGVSRPKGSAYDIGAYEYVSNCDINNDSSVDSNDVTALIDIILGRASSVKGDLNNDGSKNILDLMILVSVLLGHRTCP